MKIKMKMMKMRSEMLRSGPHVALTDSTQDDKQHTIYSHQKY